MTTTKIEILVRFEVEPDNLAAFHKKIGELTAAVSAEEPGTHAYEFFLDASSTSCVLHERYPDSDALLAHLARTGPELPGLLAVATAASVYVLGDASPKAREALAAFGAKFLSPAAGFVR